MQCNQICQYLFFYKVYANIGIKQIAHQKDSLLSVTYYIYSRKSSLLMKKILSLALHRMLNCGSSPPHPGEVIRKLCIEPLGLTVTEAANGLGVSRKTLSALLNGRFGISPEMAIRLSKAFGGSAESWVTQQAQYDLWQALQRTDVTKVKAFA